MEQQVQRFRIEMMRKVPFYGDILMRLPFVENPGISTARTNGRSIEYNPLFLEKMPPEQWRFVLMHEMLHVLLFHCRRSADKDPRLWNAAADMIVNSMLNDMIRELSQRGIQIQCPPDALLDRRRHLSDETVEDLYAFLQKMNSPEMLRSGKVRYMMLRPGPWGSPLQGAIPEDLVYPDPSRKQREQNEQLQEAEIRGIILNALERARGTGQSIILPRALLKPIASRVIPWQTLLAQFLTADESEESSYITPERKYIHMDLILPGHSRDDCRIEEIWAFVDSSGSIGERELREFLTQLGRIAREFKCLFHICYWDTSVTDVYRKVTGEQKVWECRPRHSGGTDINCVYTWLRQQRIRPPLMLILTDGYFGALREDCFIPSLKNNTILVLSTAVPENNDMRRIGKITRLRE